MTNNNFFMLYVIWLIKAIWPSITNKHVRGEEFIAYFKGIVKIRNLYWESKYLRI
jgi:hypothetical protein